MEDKGKSSLVRLGEDHGRCEELGSAAPKNPSGYRERYVEKVDNGTGEALLHTS